MVVTVAKTLMQRECGLFVFNSNFLPMNRGHRSAGKPSRGLTTPCHIFRPMLAGTIWRQAALGMLMTLGAD